jgi:hypothetical protein
MQDGGQSYLDHKDDPDREVRPHDRFGRELDEDGKPLKADKDAALASSISSNLGTVTLQQLDYRPTAARAVKIPQTTLPQPAPYPASLTAPTGVQHR